MANEEVDALDAELDEELEDDEPPPAQRPIVDGAGGLAAAIKASAERSRLRRLAAQQWQRQIAHT